jgi:hypothetical protein
MDNNLNAAYWKSVICATIILFVWTSFSWMALPFHKSVLTKFPDEAAAKQLFNPSVPSALYSYPTPADEGNPEAMKGPMIFAVVQQGPMPGMGSSMGLYLAIQFVCAGIAVWLLQQTRGLSYGTKVCFLASLGLFAGVAAHLPQWAWWGFPLGYSVLEVADLIVGWTLAGLVVGKFIKN